MSLSGPTVAAVFTMPGFGLFGKTPLNVLPIIAGVYLAVKFAGKSFREYILIALFGTALGPLVTMFILETGLPPAAALLAAMGCGFAAGFILPSAAIVMLRLHQGLQPLQHRSHHRLPRPLRRVRRRRAPGRRIVECRSFTLPGAHRPLRLRDLGRSRVLLLALRFDRRG